MTKSEITVDTVDCWSLYSSNTTFREYVDKILKSLAGKERSLREVLDLRLTKEYAYCVATGQNTYSNGGAYNMYANTDS